MSTCAHRWRHVHEESLLGGSFSIGYECVECRKFVSQHEMTPAGLVGAILPKAARLIAPHGGVSRTSGGEPYSEQIIDEKGNLRIINKLKGDSE